MMTTDSELRRRFVMAIDEVLPPAPWLAGQVGDAVQRERRGGRRALEGGGPRLRLAAGAAAILITVIAVTTLLFTSGLSNRTVPNPSRIQTPLPSPTYTFTPSPAVRSASWPPGGTVPAQLAGCWQPKLLQPTDTLCLGGYSFDFGRDFITGNVVVNGSEIDFISDTCTVEATYGYDRYHYTVTGGALVLTKFPTSNTGGGNCGWHLQGSYTKLSSP
jgi:hypothetical protein